jgi:hypothetical protein
LNLLRATAGPDGERDTSKDVRVGEEAMVKEREPLLQGVILRRSGLVVLERLGDT